MPATAVDQSLVVPGIEEALPVSAEATTSRTVVNNDAMRVVAFAMDAGQELTEHASARSVAVLVGAGELRFTVDGAEHELVAGDVVYLAPGARHAVLARTTCRFTLVLVPVDEGAQHPA